MNRVLFILTILFFCTLQNATSQKTAQYYNPQWSPDGASIVFESTRHGKSSIYTISKNGNDLKKITDTLMDYGQPAWATDGNHLVYYGGKAPMQLFMNSSGGEQQKQIVLPGFDCYQPSWSVNNQIAFNLRKIGETSNSIAVIQPDGKDFKKLTVDSLFDCSTPQWSPDGNLILFQRSRAIHKPWKEITKEEMDIKKKSSEFMVMHADGSNVQMLVSNLGTIAAHCWGWDGSTVYFLNKQDSVPALCKITLLNNKPDTLLRLKGTNYSISISPDGKFITYATVREKKHAVYIQEIYKKEERKLIGD